MKYATIFHMIVLTMVISLTCALWLFSCQISENLRTHPEHNPVPTMTPISIDDGITPRRTVILVGNDPLREISVSKNITSVNGVVTVQVDTLENPSTLGTVTITHTAGTLAFDNISSLDIGSSTTGDMFLKFGGTDVLFWNTTSEVLKWWDGLQWRDFGSGSGQGFALTVGDHTNTALENTKTGQYTQIDSTTLQLSFLANVTDLTTAENFVHRIETGYSCTMLRFGKDATNHLVYEQGTTYAAVCASTVYTSTATLSASHQGRWAEYAVQVNEAGNLTFYVDGQAFDTQAMSTAMAAQATSNEILRFYEGFSGGMGPAKIGTLLTWPTTGWKGIDLEMQTFPGVVFALPLTEYGQSTVTDVIGSEPFTKDVDVSWTSVDGGF